VIAEKGKRVAQLPGQRTVIMAEPGNDDLNPESGDTLDQAAALEFSQEMDEAISASSQSSSATSQQSGPALDPVDQVVNQYTQ
jgi:hypothetical protein